jgi:metal-responsive CopG/Arc/MetJ family transcriptional regulator
MKTAISIPDSIFEAAERFARRLGISRSELYSKAVTAYIQEHRNDSVTEALNELYSEEKSSLDPVVRSMQLASLSEDEW